MDYGTRHSDIFRDHQPGTGQWLLESEEFQSWTSQNDKTLFCSGDPGAGKTVLSSVVIEHLLKNKPKTVGLALIYCNYREQASQTVEGLLSCLLRQLCEPLSPLPDQLTSLYRNHKERHTLASTLHLSEVLSSVVASYSKTYIVIDALDECEKKHREKLLKELFELQAQKGINIFATSRKISDIESIFEGRLHKEIVATEADIRKYTHGRLEVLPDFIRRDSALQEEIIVAIAKAVSGM
jgi:Cdc6-like AAA superfamily ATPase